MIGEVGGDPEVPISKDTLPAIPERWIRPHQVIVNSPEGARTVDINPSSRPVFSKEGNAVGQVLEVILEANPGDTQASLDFRFKKDPQGNSQVLTGGWGSWSSYKAGEADKLVGRRPYEKSLGGETIPFIEPGSEKERIHKTEGRSYGWVGFVRNNKGSKANLILGVLPGSEIENIRFREESDNRGEKYIIVTVAKNLEGVTSQRLITFKVFLGQATPQRQPYADLMMVFSKELSKLPGSIPLMKDRAIGFSWAAYGPGITQEIIQKEIKAGEGIYDTYTIDDGWEEASGSFRIDTHKFPDLAGLAQKMKEVGIKPGIWVCPFMVAGEGKGLPKEWLMREYSSGVRLPNPVAGFVERFMEKHITKTRALDISIPEVRAYLADRFLDLARMGFEVFKADFLSVPFTGQLQNKDKTSVEYYRQTFEEIRQRIREQLSKEIEIIGCGAPMMESIGLFNGMRFTRDSTLPNLEGMPIIGKAVPSLKRVPGLWQQYSKLNTRMYHDAVAVAGRRTLLFRGVHGLILDGIHIADEGVPLNPDKKERLNKSALALNRLGIGNLFVGDSMVRAGEQGRRTWRNFINIFKMGNVEHEFYYKKLGCKKRLPKIPDKFSPSKAS